DLGHINVFDPLKEMYIRIPAVDQAYAQGISLWQHKVIRRYAQRQLNARTDIVALAEAKADIRALVERDFNRKSTRGRKRHARFLEDHSKPRWDVRNEGTNPDCEQDPVGSQAPSDTRLEPHQQAAAASTAAASHASDDVLP